MLPWFLRHYAHFATRIFVHDNDSNDATQAIVREHSRAELVHFDSGNAMRDDLNIAIKNEAWKGCGADWVVCVDADEFLHSPTMPLGEALERFDRDHVAVPQVEGYQMYASHLPRFDDMQDLIQVLRVGVPDRLYSKRCLFSPHRVEAMNYDPGAHHCRPKLAERAPQVENALGGAPIDKLPPLYLLHYKYAVGTEALLQRHRDINARVSDLNRRSGWGFQYWDEGFTLRRLEEIRAQSARIPLM